MFHLNVKPRPPSSTERVTPGHAVDSSAIVIAPGQRSATTRFSVFRNSTASRVFPAAIAIGNPFTCFAAVVAIQHRGDGIDAQSIDMERFKPMHGAGNQES